MTGTEARQVLLHPVFGDPRSIEAWDRMALETQVVKLAQSDKYEQWFQDANRDEKPDGLCCLTCNGSGEWHSYYSNYSDTCRRCGGTGIAVKHLSNVSTEELTALRDQLLAIVEAE